MSQFTTRRPARGQARRAWDCATFLKCGVEPTALWWIDSASSEGGYWHADYPDELFDGHSFNRDLRVYPHLIDQFFPEIEDGIFPLVLELNKLENVKTHYACEGHWAESQVPYVMFSAPDFLACALAQLFYAHETKPHHGLPLRYVWRIYGYWRPEPSGDFVWVIEPNDRRILKVAPWRRKAVNADIQKIADQVREFGAEFSHRLRFWPSKPDFHFPFDHETLPPQRSETS